MSDCKRLLITGSILVLCLFIITYISKRLHEGFKTILEPEVYPNDTPLLCEYPLSHNGVMDLNYGALSKYRPILPSSYEQKTNNIRDWSNPENGSALNVTINGFSIYGVKPTNNETSVGRPNKPDLVRVNYYQSGMQFM